MSVSCPEGFDDISEARRGPRIGLHQRTANHWHGTDAFTKVAELAAAVAGMAA